MVNKAILRQLKTLKLGDLVKVQWFDASIGKGRTGTDVIDVLVHSYGIFLGCLGKRKVHIILCQNSFCFANGLYDLDYSAIPIEWSVKITLIKPGEIKENEAQAVLNSFLAGRQRKLKRRTNNHGS